jgi:hypothetical protein
LRHPAGDLDPVESNADRGISGRVSADVIALDDVVAAKQSDAVRVLPEITLRAAAVVPPIRLFDEFDSESPLLFERAVVPAASTPRWFP